MPLQKNESLILSDKMMNRILHAEFAEKFSLFYMLFILPLVEITYDLGERLVSKMFCPSI